MIGRAAAIAFAILSAPAAAVLPPAWQSWHDLRAVAVSPRSPGVIRFAIPNDVYGKSQGDLEDLRIINDAGAEVPFAIDQREQATTVAWDDAPLSETGFVRGQYTQAVADTGPGRELHNTLRLATSADEFSTWVEIAASDDEVGWRIVRDRAPIYRFSSDGLKGNLAIPFDATRNRWLRIRVQNGSGEFPILGCQVANELTSEPELSTVLADLRVASPSHAQQTVFTADFGAPNIPVSEVLFSTSTVAFYRTVSIESSDDQQSWSVAGQGDIYRDPRAGARLSVGFSESRGRFWRITIFDRNDRALSRVRASLLATPRYVSFRAQAAHSYSVIYGNPNASAPQYDFSRLTTAAERLAAPIAVLGPAEFSSVSPRQPWTESHSFVLWLALLIAVAVMVWLAIGALRAAPKAS